MLQGHLGKSTYSQVLSAGGSGNFNDRVHGDVGNKKTQSSNVFSTVNGGSENSNQSGSIFSFLNSEITKLFNVPMSELIKQLKDFIPKYKSETDDMLKGVLIVEFLSMFIR